MYIPKWMAYQGIFYFTLLLKIVHVSPELDPYRWIQSYGKPVIQSSTEGVHVASYITDGDYNIFDHPLNYSLTTAVSQPYVQIDLGESVNIAYIQLNVPAGEGLTSHNSLTISIGDDPSIPSITNDVCGSASLAINEYYFKRCGKKGRYLTVQKTCDSCVLYFTEIAAYTMPIENLAFKKHVASSPVFNSVIGAAKNAVDMSDITYLGTTGEQPTWLRVDLDATYLIVEVLVYARRACCLARRLCDVELRIGNSLANDGNSNPLCKTISVYPGGIRSFFCHMFGRYVNFYRMVSASIGMDIGDLVINPETTENIASFKTTFTNTTPKPGQGGGMSITDTMFSTCYSPQDISRSKKIWIILGANYEITMVRIVNHGGFTEQAVDFRITVGMSDVYSSSIPCVSGLQSMVGVNAASFYCDQRITGNHVFIYQERKDRQNSVCEIGVFEETKPKIMDMKTDQRMWVDEGSDLTLKCDVKGYPVPLLSWKKDNEIIKNNSDALEITDIKFNQSGRYECWAKNKHGVDAKAFYLTSAGDLRVCVKYSEVEVVANNQESDPIELSGNDWYKFFDRKAMKELKFQQSPSKLSQCRIWLNGAHPKAQDGVVSRKLCVRNETHDCSKTFDVFIRRCATYYVYNLRKVYNTASFCFQNVKDAHGGFQPVMASPARENALSGKIFHTELEVLVSYECLMMCQLETRCKSFNYSKKFKKCELNDATKKEFPGKYGANRDYDYYEMSGGVVKDEL